MANSAGTYCDIGDVKARAGRVREAWDDTTSPSDADIERFIRDASALVDAAMISLGYTAPAADGFVLGSLLPVVADLALLMTLSASWPGDPSDKGVQALKADVEARVYGKDGKGGYMAGLRDGTLPALVLLKGENPEATGGASSFWETEKGYSSWLDDWQSGGAYVDAMGFLRVRSPLGPGIHRDTKF